MHPATRSAAHAILAASLAFASHGAHPRAAAAQSVDPTLASRFADLALACVRREFPNQISHVLLSDDDVRPPRLLTPAFFGCYDWHSSVHGHWLLARVARLAPALPEAQRARSALARSITPEHIAGEVRYVSTPGREAFERPYGLAWLLQLAAELREWDDAQARELSRTLAPLERLAADRLRAWLPKLTAPVRIGEHGQTAFAFGLVTDWARVVGDTAMERLMAERVRTLYEGDVDCPLSYEPSGQDFLSPCLAEADLVRRFLPPAEYAEWLTRFLPGIPGTVPSGAASASAAEAGAGGVAAVAVAGGRGGVTWLEPAVVTDPTDPKLAHLDGLNLSRAWMLEGIAEGLPGDDPRLPAIRSAAEAHRKVGIAAITGEHYVGSHWLGTFGMYLATRRGIGR